MERTIGNFLKTALLPVGKVLYIYGGGWNKEDKGAGEEAVMLGLSPKWERFYRENAVKGYNYRDYNYINNPESIHMGLDCSGYVGWTLYNLFNDKNGGRGFVDKSTVICKNLEKSGLGSLKASGQTTDFLAGDIMGGEKTEHIFICVSKCSDGSLLLLHGSPPAPMLSGTLSPEGEKTESSVLAEKYMKREYPRHSELFPRVNRPFSYLTDFNRFRFYDSVVSGPENYKSLSSEDILKALFSEE